MRSTLFLALTLLTVTCAWGKKKPVFETIPHVTYMMRLDNQRLVHSDNPLLPPWIPEKQFGWQIPNQDLLDHFFRQTGNGNPPLQFDFDRYLVLAILRYDAIPWMIDVKKVIWDEKDQHLQLTCVSLEAGGPQSEPTLTSLLVLIEKDESFGPEEKIGFSVAEQFVDHFILHRGEGLHAETAVFPFAYVLPEPTPRFPATAVAPVAYTPPTPAGMEIEDHTETTGTPILAVANRTQRPAPSDHLVIIDETPSFTYAAQTRRVEAVKREAAADLHSHEQPAPPTHISYLDLRGEFPLMQGVSFEDMKGFMPRRQLYLSPGNYFLIANTGQWNNLMEPTLPGVPSGRLVQAPDFDRHLAIVIVKYGHELWEFETGQAFVSDNRLTLNYRADVQHAAGDWVGSSTHIILVEKSGFSQLSLMENGKLVKQTTFNYDAGEM